MDWPELMARMLDDKHVTFLEHEGGDVFMVIDEACWLNPEEAADVRELLAAAGAEGFASVSGTTHTAQEDANG